MNKLTGIRLIQALLVTALLITAWLPMGSIAGTAQAKQRMPFSLALGKTTYNKRCLECHGAEGVGSDKGPPLMHQYYEPSHHSDISFLRAMSVGVKQHHWQFGDMPPVPDLSDKEMRKVIEYVRWMQRQQGIGH